MQASLPPLHVDVAVAGGGPGGLATAHAILTARPGTRVAVLERSSLQPRGALFWVLPNGCRALEAIRPELKAAVAAHSVDLRKTRRYSATGELQSASDDGAAMAAIRREGDLLCLPWHALQRELAEALPPACLYTDHAFVGYSETPEGVAAEFATPQGVRRVQAALLVGCDGGQSGVRAAMLGDGPPDFLGTAIWRGVRPVPADWPVDQGWLSWHGGPGRAGVLTGTLHGGSIAWQIFKKWPAERLDVIGGGRRSYIQDGGAAADAGAAAARRLGRALEAVEGYPREVLELVGGTDPGAVTEHGQFAREAAACQAYARGRVALVGDAAHLATPMLGQGCSQALEDGLELGRAVGRHGLTPEALLAYQAVRLPLSSAVQAKSVQLFRDYAAGKGGGANEFEISIQEGFAQRTFQPLAAAAVGAMSS